MKILHITYGFNGGGVGFVIANYCTNRPMPGIEFDIVGESIGKPHLLQERFEKAGFHTFYVTPKKENILKNIMEMYYIFNGGDMMLCMSTLRNGHFYICGLLKYVG